MIEHHLQVVIALGSGSVSAENFDRALVNPEYDRAYSGEYWQIDGPDGLLLTSRSLFGEQLPTPQTNPSGP